MGASSRLVPVARVVALAITACLSASPASAFSGAEYLQSDESFAAGYAWGALEANLGVFNAAVEERAERQRDCLDGANLGSNTLHEAVQRHIQSDPSHLTEPAFVAVLKVIAAMCPDPE